MISPGNSKNLAVNKSYTDLESAYGYSNEMLQFQEKLIKNNPDVAAQINMGTQLNTPGVDGYRLTKYKKNPAQEVLSDKRSAYHLSDGPSISEQQVKPKNIQGEILSERGMSPLERDEINKNLSQMLQQKRREEFSEQSRPRPYPYPYPPYPPGMYQGLENGKEKKDEKEESLHFFHPKGQYFYFKIIGIALLVIIIAYAIYWGIKKSKNIDTKKINLLLDNDLWQK